MSSLEEIKRAEQEKGALPAPFRFPLWGVEIDPIAWVEIDYATNPMIAKQPTLVLNYGTPTVLVSLRSQVFGTPASEFYRLALALPLSVNTDAEDVSEAFLAGKFEALLERIHAGWNLKRDAGGNLRGYLDEDALDALTLLHATLCSSRYALPDDWGLWRADEFLDWNYVASSLDPSDDDQTLERKAMEFEEDAREDGWNVVLAGTLEYLKQVRQDLQEAEEAGA